MAMSKSRYWKWIFTSALTILLLIAFVLFGLPRHLVRIGQTELVFENYPTILVPQHTITSASFLEFEIGMTAEEALDEVLLDASLSLLTCGNAAGTDTSKLHDRDAGLSNAVSVRNREDHDTCLNRDTWKVFHSGRSIWFYFRFDNGSLTQIAIVQSLFAP